MEGKEMHLGFGDKGPMVMDSPPGTSRQEIENAMWSRELFDHIIEQISEPLPYTICYYDSGMLYPLTNGARNKAEQEKINKNEQ